MKQKISLVLCFNSQPKVLFLDRPTTGVDQFQEKSFWEMLKRLQQKESPFWFLRLTWTKLLNQLL
jgi:ABC-type multidrug transport system ATPase subunit